MTKDPIMSESTEEGLDRRDFMIASIATVGASAVLTRNVGPAEAQETGASTRDAASSAPQGTVYTGDLIQGKKVVSLLDVNDLEPGEKTLWYFRGFGSPTEHAWYVSRAGA